MREEFATVDEVNTVLTNYVLKSDLPQTVDMSEFRKMNDLSVSTIKNISFTRISKKQYETGPFIENAIFKMSYTYSDEKTYNVNYKFVRYSHPSASENKWIGNVKNSPIINCVWRHDTSTDKYTFHLTGFSQIDTPDYDLTIESITYNDVDEIALKSDIPEPVDLSNYALKSEIPTDYVKTTGNETLNGSLTINTSELRDRVGIININTTQDNLNLFGQTIYAPNLGTGNRIISSIGLSKDKVLRSQN